jgi:putative spermidine/putrescine transport system permease protein
MNTLFQVSRRPLSFVLPVMGLMGAFIGLFIGPAFGSALIGIIFGSLVAVILAYGISATEYLRPKVVR